MIDGCIFWRINERKDEARRNYPNVMKMAKKNGEALEWADRDEGTRGSANRTVIYLLC